MGTFARRVAVLVALGAIVATGCAKDETVSSTSTPVTAASGAKDAAEGEGADDDKGGDYADACELIGRLDDLKGNDEIEAGLGVIDDIKAAGPEELEDDWDILADAYDQIAGVDENDAEALGKVIELTSDPAFIEAATNVSDFAQDECGKNLGILPDDGKTGGLTEDTTETGSTTFDDDPTSISSLKAHLEDEYGTEAWWPVIEDASGWMSSGTADVDWTVTLSDSSAAQDLPVSDLVAACDAMADYLDTYATNAIEIADADGTTLVTRSPDEPCAAA